MKDCLLRWGRTSQLAPITVPDLVIFTRYDTMDPAHMQMMTSRLATWDLLGEQHGRA
jgi:hypothetical protein